MGNPVTSSFATHFKAGTYVCAAAWIGSTLALALGDGSVSLFEENGGEKRVDVHPNGSVVAAVADANRLVTGGSDGRVVSIDGEGQTLTIAQEGKAWIDALALHSSGALAWSAGQTVTLQQKAGTSKTAARATALMPSSVRGLTFMPKGLRLAIAHYDGASLWYPGTSIEPERLFWKGSHLGITVSPDGRFVVTSMQENALHGWRLNPTPAHMRMTGYAAKPRSLSWSHDGRGLATSGADAVIIWPFKDKDGPQGKTPGEVGVRPARVTCVAFHPQASILAAGYGDGCIVLIHMSTMNEQIVRRKGEKNEVTSLIWNRSGDRLAFGTASGDAGFFTLAGS